MQVILLERVEKLGQMGDVVTVKDGFARNFLLPRSKALRANKANIELFEQQRKELEARNLERRSEAEAVAGKVAGLSVILIRQAGESGQLYGSATARDIAGAAGEKGLNIDRSQVVLERPIKTLGLHEVRVVLHPEVSLGIEVNVARSADEAELQAQGISVSANADEDEQEEEVLQAEAADSEEAGVEEAEAADADEEESSEN